VRLIRHAVMLLALACAIVPAAHAEYAVLASGARLHITGYERMGDTLRLHLPGGNVDMPAADVLRIEPEEVFAPVVAKLEGPLARPYADLIRAAAAKYGLDQQLVASVIAVESNFNPRAISRKNAQGLMQLMPETSRLLAVRNPFDPAQNIDAGAHYLKQLLDLFSGNLPFALAAYNAGPDRVTQYGGIPPYRETREYVQRVTSRLDQMAVKASPPGGVAPK
jgi:soluble lytic murein transglycosylase-like protein